MKYDVVRSGNIVVAVVPKRKASTRAFRATIVGLVVTVWRSSKKPKLCTGPVSMDHCCALRLIELEPNSDNSAWHCNEQSQAWLVDPQACALVLDCSKYQDSHDGCSVVLTESSRAVVEKAHELTEGWQCDVAFSLYVPRRKKKSVSKKDTDKDPKQKENKAKTKTKKVKLGKMGKKLKKKMQEYDFTPEICRKNSVGSRAVSQELQRLRDMDSALFPEILLFTSADDSCKLKDDDCIGVKFGSLQELAMAYFKCRLGSVAMGIGRGWTINDSQLW